MIQALIIEDENLARSLLKDYIREVPFMECIGECTNPLQALTILETARVDLIFLDIRMPKLSGLDLLRQLPNHPYVIFTTAFAEHALMGYDFNTIDYLVKPISFDRFLKACLKARSIIGPKPAETLESTSKTVDVVDGNRILKIKPDDLLYASSDGDYANLFLLSGKHQLRTSLRRLLTYQLGLVRVHKSFAINPRHVEVVNSRSVVIRGIEIPVGRSYKLTLDHLK